MQCNILKIKRLHPVNVHDDAKCQEQCWTAEIREVSGKMFLDCMTKPCSVVVSRIPSGVLSMPSVHESNPKKWVVRNDHSSDGSHLKRTLKLVRDTTIIEEETLIKCRKVSPLTLYTQIQDGLVTDVCCKRFKKRRHVRRNAGRPSSKLAATPPRSEVTVVDEVREALDWMLHQVTVSAMDAAEMDRLVRVFCRDHGFNASEFDDPSALLQPSNVVTNEETVKRKRRERKRKFFTRSVAARRVTTPPKTGIVYISDSEETPDKDSFKSKEVTDSHPSPETADETGLMVIEETASVRSPSPIIRNHLDVPKSPSPTFKEPLPVVTKVQETTPLNVELCGSEDNSVSSERPQEVSGLEESILRTLLLEPEPEPGMTPPEDNNNTSMPVISEVVSLRDEKQRDSPEIVEVKVQPTTERKKTVAEVVQNLRLEIAALEKLAAEKERERRLLLYFKSCKEELLKRLTPEPVPPPAPAQQPPPPQPPNIKSDIFSSVSRLSESSSFRPYPETRCLANINSYKSLMLTTAGQWSTAGGTGGQLPPYGSQLQDYYRSRQPLWPSYNPPPVSPSDVQNKDQWRRLLPNLVGQLQSQREKPVSSTLPQCVVCKVVKAAFLCSGCGKEWYCSEQCQRQNWRLHSRNCSS